MKTANYYVLKNTDAPAVLIETAFIDNPDDAKLLVDREDDFARAIARGVTDYFSNEKPLPDVIDVQRKFQATVSANTLPKANSCATVADAA